MGAANLVVDETHLSHLSPLNKLHPELLDELLSSSRVERLPPGRRLFNKEETDNRAIFLLAGQLALVSETSQSSTLKALTSEANSPVDDHQPRRYTAIARTAVTVLTVDSNKLNELLDRNETVPAPQPPPTHDDADRIRRIFEAPLFARLPRPHLQVLKNRTVEIAVGAGEILIREGDDSQHYYIITEGLCRVTRHHGRHGHPVTLSELRAGEGFGEGALISNDYHDATVTALTGTRVLRFSKGEFLTLLVRPYIKWITYQELAPLREAGATLLDVRSPEVFHKRHLHDSVNFPLRVLRQTAFILDRSRNYVVCCDNGRRSATAAFLLAQQGMDVKILSDGIRSAIKLEQELDKASGDDTPAASTS